MQVAIGTEKIDKGGCKINVLLGGAGAAEGLYPRVPHYDDPLLLPHRLARHRPRRGRPQGLRSRTTDRFSPRPDILLSAPIELM